MSERGGGEEDGEEVCGVAAREGGWMKEDEKEGVREEGWGDEKH